MGRAMRHRRVLVIHQLQIVGQDDAGDGAFRLRDSHCAVHHVTNLAGNRPDRDVIARDVLEQCNQIHFLLVASAERRARLLADNRDHGLVIHLRVIEPIEKMDRAGAGGRVAEPDASREFRVRAGHERRHLLVADLDVLHVGLRFLQRDVQAADAVAGITEHPLEAPFLKTLPDELADIHGHERNLHANCSSLVGVDEFPTSKSNRSSRRD